MTIQASGFLIEDENRRFVARTLRTKVDKDLRDHLLAAGATMQDIARDGFRVTLNTLMKFVFPRNKKVGAAAIDRDLNKIFAPIDSREALRYYDQNFGDGTSIRSKKKRGARKVRKVQDADFNWQGDQSRMRAWHHSRRNNKGLVTNHSRTVATFGDVKIANAMYVPRSAYNKYRRAAKQSIATYKAGWQPALEYIGRVTGGRIVLPAFVRKQADKRGKIFDGLTKSGEGYIEATNLVPYSERLTEFWMGVAIRRTDKYLRKATPKQMDKTIERFNKL